VKGELERLFKSVDGNHENYYEVYRKVEQNKNDLDQVKEEELTKVTEAFRQMKIALDVREAEFKRQYEQRVRD